VSTSMRDARVHCSLVAATIALCRTGYHPRAQLRPTRYACVLAGISSRLAAMSVTNPFPIEYPRSAGLVSEGLKPC